MIIEILSAAGASDYIDEVRTKVIADSVEKCIRHLQKISGTQIQRQDMSGGDRFYCSITDGSCCVLCCMVWEKVYEMDGIL